MELWDGRPVQRQLEIGELNEKENTSLEVEFKS
jgi:hypothetical protein